MPLTDSRFVPYLNPNKEYVYLLEHLEPAMEVDQLDRIIKKHNAGMDYRLIAKQERRNPAEVILAIIHQATVSQKSCNKGTVAIKRRLARLV